MDPCFKTLAFLGIKVRANGGQDIKIIAVKLLHRGNLRVRRFGHYPSPIIIGLID